MTVDPRTPVIVGVAQYVDRTSEPAEALTPLAMLEKAARDAAADCGAGDALWARLDALAVVRTFSDSAGVFRPPFWRYKNLPAALARKLGAAPRQLDYPPAGGDSPQLLISQFCADIAEGKIDMGLVCGVEAQRTQARAARGGGSNDMALDWSDDDDLEPTPHDTAMKRPPLSAHEIAHGMTAAPIMYTLYENAIGHHRGLSPLAHRQAIGRLMAGFSAIAAQNPNAAIPIARSAEAIITPGPDNRYIAYPYTKYLNANLFVDQSAAIIVLSTALADALGVPQSKRVYLHGSAAVSDKYLISERINYWSSPAIRLGAKAALEAAGKTIADMDMLDFYSCFAAVPEVTADALGLAEDDPRGFTITGGLPYFGGPGNNYVSHSIAEMVERLRARPDAFGLITANSMFVTNHAFGVYSATPGAYASADNRHLQAQIDALASPPFTTAPEGTGTVETFSVVYNRDGPAFGIIIGRLAEGDVRFLARITDPDDIASMIDQPVIGRRVQVMPGEKVNLARF